MTIQEILNYIAKTPENANVNVVSGMLNELAAAASASEPSEDNAKLPAEAFEVDASDWAPDGAYYIVKEDDAWVLKQIGVTPSEETPTT